MGATTSTSLPPTKTLVTTSARLVVSPRTPDANQRRPAAHPSVTRRRKQPMVVVVDRVSSSDRQSETSKQSQYLFNTEGLVDLHQVVFVSFDPRDSSDWLVQWGSADF